MTAETNSQHVNDELSTLCVPRVITGGPGQSYREGGKQKVEGPSVDNVVVYTHYSHRNNHSITNS